jgi:hypothetical protein
MNQLNLHKLPYFALTELLNSFLDELLTNLMAFTL